MQYFLSIGSNLEDRKDNLARALSLLNKEGVELIKISSLYESQPVDFSHQPWFLNQVIEVQAHHNPEALLGLIKSIEQKMGRWPSFSKGPRLIDIDILLAEDVVMKTERLEIPHPRLDRRNFILIPFKEISSHTIHPVLNKTIEELWKLSKDSSAVNRINSS